MATIRTNLKYKKAQKNIDYAFAALSFAKKQLKDERDSLEKEITPILQNLFSLHSQISQKTKNNKNIIASLDSLRKNILKICASENPTDKEKIAELEASIASVFHLSNRLLKQRN